MAAKKMSENTRLIFDYLKENNGKKVTAADIAEALNLPKKSVDGAVTSGLCKKDLAERTPAQIKTVKEDGTSKYVDVKFISLTEKGMAFDPDAEVEAVEE